MTKPVGNHLHAGSHYKHIDAESPEQQVLVLGVEKPLFV